MKQAERGSDVSFAHPSERLFAEVLDFYGVRWQYEPRSFPLRWAADGAVAAAFTPDFYLPELDLYVEVTTMSQKLVTRKNRKVRQLKERYPHIRCRVLYQRDIHRLAAKHGVDFPVGASN
jgi:hypoxanthine phosphoribosyltransferase